MSTLSNVVIKGKPITRFPVYVKKENDPTHVEVISTFNEVSRINNGKLDIWVNAGPAPADRNRAVFGSTPSSPFNVTKNFEIWRIVKRNGNSLQLFPDTEFTPSVTWLKANRPKAGDFLLRHSTDYYTSLSEKTFHHIYGGLMDEETYKELRGAYTQSSKPHAKEE